MIKIKIEKNTRQVYLNNGFIGNDNENLQDNLEFSFKDEFVNGQARLELQFENKEKTFIVLDKVEETYITPITNIMTITGQVYAQLVVTEGIDGESIPIFKSNIFYFYVGESINAETGDEEPYIEWIDRANAKLNQIDNLDISATKVENTATITITKKDGTTQEVEILDGQDGARGEKGQDGYTPIKGVDYFDGQDGKDGTNGIDGKSIEYNWEGTSLGIRQEGQSNYDYVNLKGEMGSTGNGIVNTSKTSTSGLVDTYTITYTNGGTDTFTVTNGEIQDISGKLDVSKVKNTTSTTSGDVYDVTYINTMLGDIEQQLSEV